MPAKSTESAILVTGAAFARSVGVSNKAICNAIDAGRFSKKVLVKVGKRFKLREAAARAEWFAYKGVPDPLGGAVAVAASKPPPKPAPARKAPNNPPPAASGSAPFDFDDEDEDPGPRRLPPRKAPFGGFGGAVNDDEDEDPDEGGGFTYGYDHRLGMDLPKGTLNDLRARNEAIKAAKAEVELKKLIGSLVDVSEARRALFAVGQEVRTRFESMPARIVDQITSKSRFDVLNILEAEINAILTGLGELSEREITNGGS